MEDPTFLHQWHLSSIDTSTLAASAFGETLQKHPFSNLNFNPKTSMETSPTVIERPAQQHKNNSWNHNQSPQTSESRFGSCSNILSFVDSNYTSQLGLVKPKVEETLSPKIDSTTPADMLISQGTLGNQNFVFKACHEAKNIGTRSRLSQPHDHIIAERKRREKLSQRFIALSALVPGLKKVSNKVVSALFDIMIMSLLLFSFITLYVEHMLPYLDIKRKNS